MCSTITAVGKYRLIIHSLESGEEKDLAGGSLSEGLQDPAWSPDGRLIVGSVAQPGEALSGLVAIEASGGNHTLFFTSNTKSLERPAWLPDGSGLLVLERDLHSNQAQVVFVSYPGGKSSAVTRDTNNYSDLSLAADGHTLATVLSQIHSDLFTVPAGASGALARQLTSGTPVYHLSWTRDNQLVTTQPESGLALLNPDSGAKTPLLSQGSRSVFTLLPAPMAASFLPHLPAESSG